MFIIINYANIKNVWGIDKIVFYIIKSIKMYQINYLILYNCFDTFSNIICKLINNLQYFTNSRGIKIMLFKLEVTFISINYFNIIYFLFFSSIFFLSLCLCCLSFPYTRQILAKFIQS